MTLVHKMHLILSYLIIEIDSCKSLNYDSLQIYADNMSSYYCEDSVNKNCGIQIVFTKFNPDMNIENDVVFNFKAF